MPRRRSYVIAAVFLWLALVSCTGGNEDAHDTKRLTEKLHAMEAEVQLYEGRIKSAGDDIGLRNSYHNEQELLKSRIARLRVLLKTSPSSNTHVAPQTHH